MCDTCKAIHKEVLEQLDYCKNYLRSLCHEKSSEFNEALDMDEKELPKHINDSGLIGEMVKERLAGEDIDVPKHHIRALCDVEMDYETYRDLGKNDGALEIISVVLNKLGDEEHAQEASNCQYGE